METTKVDRCTTSCAESGQPHAAKCHADSADGWHVFMNPPAATIHTRLLGNVLCRWWGDGPVPPGVALIDAAAQAWTKVCGVMPDDEITVLLAFTDGEVWPGYKDGDTWRDLSGMPIGMDGITHWMHMPAGPVEAAA